jgi:glycosyltransferase involved in cell wall biosynthesis
MVDQIMPKVLWISDSPRIRHVGQSVVTRAVLSRLQGMGYNVEALGFLDSKIRPEDKVEVPYNVIDCHRGEMHDVKRMVEYITASDPEVVIMSHDPWVLPVIPQLRQMFPKKRFIGYLTLDGAPCYYAWRNIMKGYHKVVSPTRFGKSTVNQRWADVDIDVAPYGVDHAQFHLPQQGKPKLKEDISDRNHHLGEFGSLRNKFVGLYIGANQDRKNLGVIHEAWREFEKGKEDHVVLMMFVHSASLTEEAGAYDLVVFTQDTQTMRIINAPQPDDIIGMYTAAADILVHPSAGEGWGLTVSNAMACGTVPVILPYAGVTDFCTPENSYGAPFIEHVGGFHVHRAITTADGLCDTLNHAYANPNDRVAKAYRAIETAQGLNWDITAQILDKNIKEVLAMPDNGIFFSKVC